MLVELVKKSEHLCLVLLPGFLRISHPHTHAHATATYSFCHFLPNQNRFPHQQTRVSVSNLLFSKVGTFTFNYIVCYYIL
jgi:hypothetical protein